MKKKLKAASSPFLPSALPQTRKDQFFFILRNRYGTLFFLGLWLLLTFSPIILTAFFQSQLEIGFYQKYRAGSLSEEDYRSSMNVLLIYGTLLETAFTFIASISLSGANRIMRSLLWGEGILFWGDFKIGIKQNYRNTALLFFFFGILLSLCRFVESFYIEYLLGIPFYILLILLVIPIFIIASIFSSVYECGPLRAIVNATKLYFPYWWKYLLSGAALFLALYALTWLETLPVLVALTHILLCAFLLPIYLLFLYSLSFSLFDKYINREHFPAYYHAGLYVPKNKERKFIDLL